MTKNWAVESAAMDDRVLYYRVIDDRGRTILDCCNSEVAEIHEEADEDGVSRWDERGRNDCTLAAAAPELLEACQAVIEATGGSKNWNGETERFLKLCEAAIAKATGKETLTAGH